MTMSTDYKFGPCAACGKYHVRPCPRDFKAKEPYSGSPLESVVQGRLDSPVPSNPDRSGDATRRELLAWIIKHASRNDMAECWIRQQMELFDDIDTAPDTKSGSAGVP